MYRGITACMHERSTMMRPPSISSSSTLGTSTTLTTAKKSHCPRKPTAAVIFMISVLGIPAILLTYIQSIFHPIDGFNMFHIKWVIRTWGDTSTAFAMDAENDVFGQMSHKTPQANVSSLRIQQAKTSYGNRHTNSRGYITEMSEKCSYLS
ncbi:hypothetical protein B0J17DRAFT_623980 [Rhizoctonia solani]|nr:hypothetical protein B0J17DRAFT_623980 [Rhizoctonia solani]